MIFFASKIPFLLKESTSDIKEDWVLSWVDKKFDNCLSVFVELKFTLLRISFKFERLSEILIWFSEDCFNAFATISRFSNIFWIAAVVGLFSIFISSGEEFELRILSKDWLNGEP